MSAPIAAPAIAAQENLLIAGSIKAVSKRAVNLSLVKIGPLVATILGGIFAAITLASAAAIIAIIIVSSAPIPPNAAPSFATTNKMVEVRIPVLLNARDARGSEITIASVSKPAHGTAQIIPRVGNVPQQVAYVSDRLFSGVDSFNYTIKNTAGATASSYVQVTVVNRPPVAANLYFKDIVKGSIVVVDVLNTVNSLGQQSSDPDTDTLTPVAVTSPVAAKAVNTGAAVTISNGQILFTPPQSYRGEVSFNYTIADVDGATASATVTLDIIYKNPVATQKLFTFPKATVKTLDLMAGNSDPNGDAIFLPWNDPTTPPVFNLASGSFEKNDNNSIIYTPQITSYYDSFSYYIQNTGGLASVGLAIIEMYNSAPSISATAVSVSKNSPTYVPLSFTFSDPDIFDSVTVSVDRTNLIGDVQVTSTRNKEQRAYYENGFYSVDVYNYTIGYKPANGFVGSEKITLIVNDNQGKTNSTASTTLEVTVFNSAPVANADFYVCVAGKECILNILENDSDPNNDDIIIAQQNPFTSVTIGVLTRLNNKQALYVPPASRPNQPIVFNYIIEDVQAVGYTQYRLFSSPAQVTIRVEQNPEDFFCTPSVDLTVSSGPFPHTGPITITDLLVRLGLSTVASDSTFTILSSTSTRGTFTINSVTNVVYNPGTPISAGSGTATFTVKRGEVYVKICSVVFTVGNKNPTANDVTRTYVAQVQNVQHTIDLIALSGASDPDGDAIKLKSVAVVGSCPSGSLSISGTVALFSPAANTPMVCNFDFVITDSVGGVEGLVTKRLTVNVNVKPPVAVNDYFEVNQADGSRVLQFQELLRNDVDESGGVLQIPNLAAFSPNSDPNIVININAKTVTVRWNTGRCDSVIFSYTPSNGMSSATQAARVQVKPINCKCSIAIDILFVLDGSTSISSTNWNNMKNFISGIISPTRITMGASNVKVGVIQYSGSATFSSPYGYLMQSDQGQTATLTKDLNQLFGSTATRDGLRVGFDYMRNRGGARANTPVSIVLITDGDSNRPCSCQEILNNENYVYPNAIKNICPNGYGNNNDCEGSLLPNCKCNDAYVKIAYQKYADVNGNVCNNCAKANRCMPCANPIPVGNQIKGTANYRLISLGVGDGISDEGKVQIGSLNIDGVYRSAPWNDLATAMSLIVDRACDTTGS